MSKADDGDFHTKCPSPTGGSGGGWVSEWMVLAVGQAWVVLAAGGLLGPNQGATGVKLVNPEASLGHYCQEWEIDQQLQFCRCNFIFLILLCFLKQNIRPKYARPRRGKYKVNWRGGFAAPTC